MPSTLSTLKKWPASKNDMKRPASGAVAKTGSMNKAVEDMKKGWQDEHDEESKEKKSQKRKKTDEGDEDEEGGEGDDEKRDKGRVSNSRT